MKTFDVVIVGGGPAGLTTAISAKNTYPEKSIALIRREKTALIPCGIPYILATLNSVEDDILPDKPLHNNDVELIIDNVVDKRGNVLLLESGEEIQFDKLVLATGSKPFVPPIEGIDKEGVYFVSKDMEYLRNLKNTVKDTKKIVVIGGGFIGIEITDELLKLKKKATIVEKLPTLLPLAMDKEFGNMALSILKDMGVDVYVDTLVEKITGNGKVDSVVLTGGKKIDADIVIVSAGYRANLELAKKLGVAVNERYGVIVDEYLKTSEDGIFAVGDCAAKRSCFTGEYSKIMLASTAMAQGRLVGSNLFGIKVMKVFTGTLGTFSTKIGNVSFGVSGLTESQAKSLGIDYFVGTNEAVDRHPGKLPGVSKVYTKLIFSRYSHILLGAQIKGGDSIGELVNMYSVIIQNRMTDMEIDTLQIGTHPLLTPSPIAYPAINATVNAILKGYK